MSSMFSCANCARSTGSRMSGGILVWTCEAFPAGIPYQIAYEGEDHAFKNFPGDGGMMWEPSQEDIDKGWLQKKHLDEIERIRPLAMPPRFPAK